MEIIFQQKQQQLNKKKVELNKKIVEGNILSSSKGVALVHVWLSLEICSSPSLYFLCIIILASVITCIQIVFLIFNFDY